MNGLPWYKAFPRDFIEGTIGMPFELKGAYRLVLDLIYMQNGELPDDPRYISGLLNCSVRKWNSMRSQLVKLDKIQITGEFISNYRAVIDLESLAKLQDKQSENASGSRKNKDLQKPRPNHTEPEPEKKKLLSTVSKKAQAQDAFDLWNVMAKRVGLSQGAKMTAAREGKLKARLKDCGGIDGWTGALDMIENTPGLCGKAGGGWKANLDWLLTESGFTKLMEGNYSGWTDARRNGGKPSGDENQRTRREAIARQLNRKSGSGEDVAGRGGESTRQHGDAGGSRRTQAVAGSIAGQSNREPNSGQPADLGGHAGQADSVHSDVQPPNGGHRRNAGNVRGDAGRPAERPSGGGNQADNAGPPISHASQASGHPQQDFGGPGDTKERPITRPPVSELVSGDPGVSEMDIPEFLRKGEKSK